MCWMPCKTTLQIRVKWFLTHSQKPLQLLWKHVLSKIVQCYQNAQKVLLKCINLALHFNTLRPRRKGCHYANGIFKCIFLNENVLISIKNSLKFNPNDSIKNILALVQIPPWHRAGDKSLFEPMIIILLRHICVTRPQWVKWVLWDSETGLLEAHSHFWKSNCIMFNKEK